MRWLRAAQAAADPWVPAGLALLLIAGFTLLPLTRLSHDILYLFVHGAVLACLLLPRLWIWPWDRALRPWAVMSALLLALFVWTVFLVYLHGTNRYLHMRVEWPLYAVPLALAARLCLLKDPARLRLFLAVLAVSVAAGLTLTSLAQAIWNDPADFEGRSHGGTNPIPFSEVLLTSGGVGALLLAHRLGPGSAVGVRAIWALALALLVLATQLTGTRGTFILVFPLLLALALMLRGARLTVLPALALAVALAAAAPRTGLAVAEVAASLDGNAAGSVGLRVQMWQAAWAEIVKAPLLGKGVRDFRMLIDGAAWPAVADFYHAHNQYIDLWLKTGLPGMLLLLALQGAALWFAWTRRGGVPADHGVAAALAWVSLSFLGYGMTQAFLGHVETSLIPATYLLLLGLALATPAPREA